MAHVKPFVCLFLMAFATPLAAARIDERAQFPAPPVAAPVLAATHSFGNQMPGNFEAIVSERLRGDERTTASVAGVSMDNWWAYVGSELIAANLR